MTALLVSVDPLPAADPSRATLEAAAGERVFARAAALFFALGDPARLRLLALLQARERCVSELAGDLGEEVSTVSQRLRLLRFHELVARRRQGKRVFYRLADAHVAELVRSGLQHACEGAGA